MRLIVVNPAGGTALRQSRLRAAVRELQTLPGRSVVVTTEAADMIGPVRRTLAANPGVTQVVACGGDGTVAACAAAIDGADIPLGIVPTGTSNVLAHELGLPSRPAEAARVLASPLRPVPFRTWTVNDRFMLLQLGVGFDGLLMWRTPRRVKRAAGFLGVTLNALRLGPFFDYPAIEVSGESEVGAAFSARVRSVLVANAKRWAGPHLTVPTADPTDDLLDVLLLNHRTFLELASFWLAIPLPGALHLRARFVRHVRLRRLTITAPGRPVEAHLDGEPTLTTPLVVAPHGRVNLLARIFHSETRPFQRKIRPPSGRGDFVAVRPDFVGPTGRRFHTSGCGIFGLAR
jgi:diacylglycerol kinase family enzyme